MNAEKAIELLKENNPPPMDSWSEELTEAVQLGIEALKREQYIRKHYPEYGFDLLPGETKE